MNILKPFKSHFFCDSHHRLDHDYWISIGTFSPKSETYPGEYKTFLIWPYAIAPPIAGLLWRLLCHPTLGWVTHFFQNLGFEFNYLIYPKQALSIIILAASWQQFSYNFLFYFGALQLIPKHLYEAAILDGATAWHVFGT